jgi:hypothetical protein
VETVNAALAFVAERRRRAEVFDDPLVWGSPTWPILRSGRPHAGDLAIDRIPAAIPAGLYWQTAAPSPANTPTRSGRTDPPGQSRTTGHLRRGRPGSPLLRPRPAEYTRTASPTRSRLHRLPPTPQIAYRARQIQAMLARRSQHRAAGCAEILTAAIAEHYGAIVLHYDTDFDHIAAAALQTRRVVARGTVP